jgi:DNA-binding SARP family transcriptional activator/tetratricopeptide (TPR) repeat protein
MFLIGSPRMFSAEGTAVVLPTMGYALVTALLLSGDAQAARGTLADQLWGQSDNRNGNLRKLLWKLRGVQKKLEVEFLHIDELNIKLRLSELQIDLSQLLALLHGEQPFSLVEICRLYTGELLENINLDGAEWNDWLGAQRTKLRETFSAAVTRRIEPLAGSADSAQIKLAARRLIEIDPYNEAACRALMETFAQEGETAQVQQVYQALRTRLETDLLTTPAPATSALFHSLTVGLAPHPFPPIWLPGSDRVPATPRVPERSEAGESQPRPATSSLLSAGVPKISILSPADPSGDPRVLGLADALIDDVTIGLCRLRSLSVLAPHTAWRVAHASSKDDVLEQFGVDYLVETRLHSKVAVPKLTVKLFEIRSREIIWAEKYPFATDDAARCSQDLSMQIISLLSSEIERKEISRFEVVRNPTAYYWYLIGQRALSSLDLPSIRRGRKMLKASVAACPDFAPATSALARSYQLEWLLLARGDHDMLTQAEDLARKAVRIDPLDARGYRELGMCNLYTGRFDESLEAYSEGERLNPQHADLLHDYADALVHSGQVDEAIAKIKQAMQLNPLCPDHYWWTAGSAHYAAREYRLAIESVSRMRNRTPCLRLLAMSHAMLGETEKAARYMRKAMETNPNFSLDKWIKILPLRPASAVRHYEKGLRLAGFT